jgi:hypothetical protein
MTPDDLRRALEARADAVEVSPDALRTIRTRIAGQAAARRRRMVFGFSSLATATAATVVAVVVGLGSCVPTTNPTPPAATTGAATPPPVTSAPPTSGPATSGPPSAAATSNPPAAPVSVRLPIYYVGTGARPVLYREFHTVRAAANTLPAAIAAAVDRMLDNDPADPDYWSPWLSGTSVRGVQVVDSVAVVDLAGADGPPGAPVPTPIPPSPVASAMVQQLVWTTTAVAAERGQQLDGVQLRFDGETRSQHWGVNVAGTLRRGPYASTAAPLWVISPQEGAVVTGTVDVRLAGAVFEATARLRVRDAAGEVVSDQVVTLSAGAPAQGTANVPLTLPPGSYTVEAYYLSPQDGSEQGLDDHTFTVG